MTNYEVPVQSIIFMGVSAILSVLIPIALLIYFKKKSKASIAPFFVGCGVFLVFALVLESLVHQLVFSTKTGDTIMDTTWLYALYGGLMAGLFEETGRFAAFKTVLKKYQGNDANALMYGAGHGGLESIVVLGISMVGNIVLAILINIGSLDAMQDILAGEAGEAFEELISNLTGAASYMYLAGLVERIFAIVLQISLSVIVWFAAKNRKKLFLFPMAILIHAAIDAVTVVMTRNTADTWLIEATVGVMAIIVAIAAKLIYLKNHSDENEKLDF